MYASTLELFKKFPKILSKFELYFFLVVVTYGHYGWVGIETMTEFWW